LPIKPKKRVSNSDFGEGTVISAQGSGGHARLQVNFEGASSKWLVASYANLTPL
jgi:DNA helicase-2/ATP-dependent DNA helicase PcrA